MAKPTGGKGVKPLPSKVVEEVRQVVGLEKVVQDYEAVDTSRTKFNKAFRELMEEDCGVGDIFLGLAISIDHICDLVIARGVPNKEQRKAMAETLITAFTNAIKVGCEVPLTDD